MSLLGTFTASFLVALPALLSIVNPLAGALIYHQVTADRGEAEKAALAWRVATYAAIVMLTALWIGAWLMSFFGVSIEALRVAGGLVVAASAWEMLTYTEATESRKKAAGRGRRGRRRRCVLPAHAPVHDRSRNDFRRHRLECKPARHRRGAIAVSRGIIGGGRRGRDLGRHLLCVGGARRRVAGAGQNAGPDPPLGVSAALHRRADFPDRGSGRPICGTRATSGHPSVARTFFPHTPLAILVYQDEVPTLLERAKADQSAAKER